MNTDPLPAPPADSPMRGSRRVGAWTFVVLLLVCAAAWLLLRPPAVPEAVASGAGRVPVVAVTKVVRTSLSRELKFDAEFRPFQDIDLHAHVAGFVQQMNVDVGSKVKTGQIVAVIEIPEFKEEIERAQAVRARAAGDVNRAEEEARRAELEVGKSDAGLKRAEAAHAETLITYERLAAVNKTQPGLVAQQELDVSQARERTTAAQVDEAKAGQAVARAAVVVAKTGIPAAKDTVAVADADVHRLQAKLAYTKITAPFDGMITKRFADVGDLIRGGLSPSAPAVPIARLVSVDKLRLVFPVSASYVARVKAGQSVEFIVTQMERKFTGVVARIAGEVDMATRSMEVQVDVPNPDGALIPGMFASVALQLDRRENVLAIPLGAVMRGAKPSVLIVGLVNSTVEEREIKLGLETASKVEVLAGLKAGDQVFVGSRSQVKPGQKVQAKVVEILTAE